MQAKTCTKCSRRLPVACYHRMKTNKDGLYPSCKDCVRKKHSSEPRRAKEVIMYGIVRRWCPRCGTYRFKTAFYTGKGYKGGICTICKDCCRAEARSELTKTARKGKAQRIRMEVLIRYGGKPPRCACCGEDTYEFLALDHINGGGNAHRKALGNGHVIHWIKKNYPAGFQVLCHNCNMAKGFYKVCPHKR